jgi:hypothetical protein
MAKAEEVIAYIARNKAISKYKLMSPEINFFFLARSAKTLPTSTLFKN